MQSIVDKHLIMAGTSIFLIGCTNLFEPVVALLMTIISMELIIYFDNRKFTYAVIIFYVIATLFIPFLTVFLPVHLYELARMEHWNGYCICILFFVNIEVFGSVWQKFTWVFILAVTTVLAVRTKKQIQEHQALLLLRDSSVEEKTAMRMRNKELMEKQDYEIKVATLSERNRIAREIHDNVGHMLSRCILQLGALMVVHKKNETIYNQLASVNESLNEAMNNIRESVHDLHNESVDLKQSILDATTEMRKKYDFKFEYDMSDNISREVKYTMITIVKEAMSNIVKHSNATKVSVMLREHPAFYQLLIEDNGSSVNKVRFSGLNAGIGLNNMKERVEALGGTINFKTHAGFSIMISIGKTMKAD